MESLRTAVDKARNRIVGNCESLKNISDALEIAGNPRLAESLTMIRMNIEEAIEKAMLTCNKAVDSAISAEQKAYRDAILAAGRKLKT